MEQRKGVKPKLRSKCGMLRLRYGQAPHLIGQNMARLRSGNLLGKAGSKPRVGIVKRVAVTLRVEGRDSS